jgi:hypothetical protein
MFLQEWQEKFEQCLAIEFSTPAYFAVHYLLVLTCMIQTDGYSQENFPRAVRVLEDLLSGMSAEQFHARCGSFEKPINNRGARDIHRYPWRLDILSIRTETAGQYCEDVRTWAADVLAVIRTTDSSPEKDTFVP